MDDLTNTDLILMRELAIQHIESHVELAKVVALRDKLMAELAYRNEIDAELMADGKPRRYGQ